MKINKQLSSSTNSKQIISLNKSLKNTHLTNGTIFSNDKSRIQSNNNNNNNNSNIVNSLINNNSNLRNSNNILSKLSSENKPVINSSSNNSQLINTSNVQNRLINVNKNTKFINQNVFLNNNKKETSTEKFSKNTVTNGVQILNNTTYNYTNANNSIKLNNTQVNYSSNNFINTSQYNNQVNENNNNYNSNVDNVKTETKISNLKANIKTKHKIVSCVKDVKINLIGNNKIKIGNHNIHNNFSNINGGIFSNNKVNNIINNDLSNKNNYNNNNNNNINSSSKDKTNVIYQRFSPKSIVKNNSNNNKKYENTNFQESEATLMSGKLIGSETTSSVNTNTNSMNMFNIAHNDKKVNESACNNISIKKKINIYSNNNHINNITGNQPMNNIYGELSKKLVKPGNKNKINITSNSNNMSSNFNKVNSNVKIGYFSENIESANLALKTEERSFRKKPNQNILEAENPEDLHFIQVEMLLQSKQISQKFESEDNIITSKNSKISPSKLPTLSVIPVEEIDM